jgi:hypothetical protein
MYSENNKSEALHPEAVVVTFAVLLKQKHFLQHLRFTVKE